MAIRILSSENITGNLTVNGIAQIGASADANFSLGSSGDTFVLTSKKNGTDGIPMIFKVQASGGAIYERINITSGSITNIDVMSTFASEGIIRIGRYDANISRYNEIKNSVTSNGADSYMKLSVHSGTENVVTDVMTLLGDGNVGIGTPSPSVGLQLGNSTLGETKTAIFNSEGGGEVGLTVQSRTNRAKLRVADNDSNAYVVAEGGEAFFGISPNGDTQNLMITPSGYMSFGSVSEVASLYIQSSFTDAPAVKFYNSSTVGDGLFVEVAASSSSEFALKVTANGGLTNVLYARADGNVGINTTSPDYKLDVSGNIRSSTLTVYDGMGGTETGIGASSAGGNLRLYTAGVNRVTVQNTNQTMILYGNSTTGSNYIQFKDSQGTSQGYLGYGSSGSNVLYLVQQKSDDIQFYSNGSTRMTINTAGDVGIGVAPEGNIVSYIKQLRIGEQTTIQGHADGVGVGSASWFSTNYIFSVGGATTITQGESMVYQVQSGRHHFSNSESTAAGAVPVLRDGFSIEPNLDLKASTKQQNSGGVGAVLTPPYNLRFNNFSGTGPKFLGVYPLRGGSQFLDIAINTTSDGIMYYAMFRGYFYGRGSRWSWTGGYTYQGSIINIQNHFVLNGNTADLTAYRGAAGSAYPANLCFRMDSGSSGYTEGFGELYIFAHATTLQNAFQVAAFAENNAANPGLWT